MRVTLQTKPERWLCLATSFAMALGITTNEFCELAGHDGGEIAFPDLPDPLCRRGFHIMEAVFVAMHRGFTATPIQLLPVIRSTPLPGVPSTDVIVGYHHPETTDQLENNWRYFQDFIACKAGVIECTTRSGRNHAVAFEFDHIFDPDGRSFPYSREGCEARGLFTTCLWIINRI